MSTTRADIDNYLGFFDAVLQTGNPVGAAACDGFKAFMNGLFNDQDFIYCFAQAHRRFADKNGTIKCVQNVETARALGLLANERASILNPVVEYSLSQQRFANSHRAYR